MQKDFSFLDLFTPLTTKKILSFIIIIGSIVFFNALFGGFIWDDKTFIVANPDVRNLDMWYLLGPNMFNNINAGQYRFFVALYFTVLHTFFGEVTFFYHLLQILLHITNTILVFLFLKKFFEKNLSFFLSLVFLVSPIQVESVSYIASSGNTLFVFFGLLALLVTTHPTTSKKIWSIFILLLFSLFCKETGIIFVLLVCFYQFLFQKNQKYYYLMYGVLTTVLYFFVRFFIGQVYFSKVELAPITRLSFFERIINVPAVFAYYIKTFFFPMNLLIEQYWTVESIDLQNFFLPLLVDLFFLIILSFLIYNVYKTKKKEFTALIFFVVWFFAGMGAYSQLFSLDMTVADRWFYFPIIGLLGILGYGFVTIAPYITRQKKVIPIVAGVIIIGLSIRTMVRNTNWQDVITLYTHDAAIIPNYDIENSLGGELSLLGREKEAFIHFKKSVALFPHETNLLNLGLSYEKQKNPTAAKIYYFKALNAKSFGEVPVPHRHHNITYQRAAILTIHSDPQKSFAITERGIKDYPLDPQLWYARTLSAYLLKKHEPALVAAKNLVELLPQNSTAQTLYKNLSEGKPIDTTVH